ncbi:HAD family hydrolase [Tengunoibacter tsumagoiensis]|uniref:Haloacid dehalogenase n=1 Tax=Tengunoibacter tsumagoiensis TaxID=2014871 RepID=A0A401ZZH1_9CHLR|nr:HAD hydrolase-like protein [Tengunoibacter tsumagoiensis]GCE12257.1 hypothetical protein KTT_21160 [Tengunoibacter tsumagoiensis]
MERYVLFLDDGGVMNDNQQRGVQWPPLVGAFFAPRLGGSIEAWAEANRRVITDLLDPANWRLRIQRATSYMHFDRDYQFDWLAEMCALVGISHPPVEECIELAHQAVNWITPQVKSAFPGVVETIHQLYEDGYTLYTASGEGSMDLEGYLTGMGVAHCFQRLYGPDHFDAFKESPMYYERLFEHSGIHSGDALIIDDTPRAINWAAQSGAQTVLIARQPVAGCLADYTIPDLAALPALLKSVIRDQTVEI